MIRSGSSRTRKPQARRRGLLQATVIKWIALYAAAPVAARSPDTAGDGSGNRGHDSRATLRPTSQSSRRFSRSSPLRPETTTGPRIPSSEGCPKPHGFGGPTSTWIITCANSVCKTRRPRRSRRPRRELFVVIFVTSVVFVCVRVCSFSSVRRQTRHDDSSCVLPQLNCRIWDWLLQN